MSLNDRLRWNARYGEGPPPGLAPYGFLLEAAERGWLPPSGRALDLACGRGDEAVWLARAGFIVDAVDISDAALAQALDRAETADVADRVRLIRADLDDGLPPEVVGPYDLICAFRFRARALYRRVAVRNRLVSWFRSSLYCRYRVVSELRSQNDTRNQ